MNLIFNSIFYNKHLKKNRTFRVSVTETLQLGFQNKKSENTRLQQSWNHNGNSRNTQEVFGFKSLNSINLPESLLLVRSHDLDHK